MTITQAYVLYEQQVLYNKADKTRRNYQSAIRSFTRAVGDVPVEIISKETVARWDMDMISRGNVPSARGANIIKLRMLLKFLRGYDIKVIHPADIPIPKRNPGPKTWLLPEEGRQMLEAATNPRDKALVAVLWETGARVSEVLSLNREDLEQEYITICGKGGKYRDITLSQATRAVVQAYLDTRRDRYPPVFLSGQSRRITVSRVEQIIHQVAMEAGIEKNVTPHVFRHSFVSNMISNNAPVKEVSELVGHAQTSTTLNIYHHVLPTQKWEAKKRYHTPIA